MSFVVFRVDFFPEAVKLLLRRDFGRPRVHRRHDRHLLLASLTDSRQLQLLRHRRKPNHLRRREVAAGYYVTRM